MRNGLKWIATGLISANEWSICLVMNAQIRFSSTGDIELDSDDNADDLVIIVQALLIVVM